MRLLTETTLNRVVNGHDKNGYAIVSAYRHDCLGEKPANISEKEWSKKVESENLARNQELKYILKKLGYSYIPAFGGYKELGTDEASVEKSLIVMPYNIMDDSYEDYTIFEEDMINVAKDYNQDSILLKSPDENPRYYNCIENVFEQEFTGKSINDVQRQYFTALKRWRDTNRDNNDWEGSPQRFTYIESYLEDNPSNIMSAHRRSSFGELLDMSDYM